MPRSKPHYHHGDLRNALVHQAVKLIEDAGAETFSLREAARLVGVSANAAYRHFADKSALLAAVAQVGFGIQERYIQRAIAAVPVLPTEAERAIERMKAAGRGYMEFAVDHRELHRVMLGSRHPSGEDGLPETPSYALLSKGLDEMVAAGVLPPNRRPGAELKAWTVVHGFATLVVEGVEVLQKRGPRTKAFEAVLDFAMIGLCGKVK
jgi:AcrR family transcriptional regulator